jgi:hypothetical protein
LLPSKESAADAVKSAPQLIELHKEIAATKVANLSLARALFIMGYRFFEIDLGILDLGYAVRIP